MELIKRKISLEPNIDRNYNSPTYGQLTASTFYINIMLTQNIDDMGMFTDLIYIPNFPNNYTSVDYTPLVNKLLISGITFPFMNGELPTTSQTDINPQTRVTGKTDSDYYDFKNIIISGIVESRIEDVQSYDKNQKYKLDFNISTETYVNYTGGTVNGVTKVTSTNPNDFKYVFDADKNDPNIGTINQKDGLVFTNNNENTNVSTVSYIGEGWNSTNTSLSATTKEEYLLGIISRPEIESDVFIDRGIITVYEKHLKMSEISNISQLSRYGNGYFNISTV
jgi:hypothetical protein